LAVSDIVELTIFILFYFFYFIIFNNSTRQRPDLASLAVESAIWHYCIGPSLLTTMMCGHE